LLKVSERRDGRSEMYFGLAKDSLHISRLTCHPDREKTMFENYLKVAVRNLLRYKAYSFINISGLALGITCCILILMYVQHELSYDRYHENADRIASF